MCTTCGCGSDEITIEGMAGGSRAHVHAHDEHHHHHHHHHEELPAHGRIVSLEQDVLAKNQLFAERNRGWFEGSGVLAVNIMSSPGAGKTTILERTIREWGGSAAISVLEGDQASSEDADRIRAAGATAVQINTGTGCHLDAHMVAHGIEQLKLSRDSVLLIENVGNLVCPALFDLGERARVLVVSVTEGEDKPVKYPHMFCVADLLLLNKLDLLPYVRFDIQRFKKLTLQTNPHLQIIPLSAQTGEGMRDWYRWLTLSAAQHQDAKPRISELANAVPLKRL